MNTILLTIITINYNNLDGLKRTIKSVVNQTWKKFEYIVIDGGSTDGSAEYIQEMKEQIHFAVSETDKGIYNAMNKGVKEAQGDYLLFLNSGDCLICDTILEEILEIMDNDDSINVHSFQSMDQNLEGNIITGTTRQKRSIQTSIRTFLKGSISHPASMIKRKINNKTWLYNEENKIVSDWEWFFKLFLEDQSKFRVYDLIISSIQPNGISRSEDYRELTRWERNRVINDLKSKYFYVKWEILRMQGLKFKNKVYLRINKHLSIVLSFLNNKRF